MLPEEPYDVVIVGSGAGGGTAAWALSEGGLRVLVLEAGPHYVPEQDYKLDQPDWETGFPHKFRPLAEPLYAPMQPLLPEHRDLRSWNRQTGLLNKTEHRISYGYHRVQGVGGSSLHFTGEAHRLNPLAMNMHTRFGVAADWPIDYQTLEPYYQQAEHLVGVAGPLAEVTRPRSKPYPQQPHPFSYATQVLAEGFNAEGMQLVPNSLAVLSAPRDGRLSCNYCAGCLRGCPRRDKGSIDVTYLQQAKANGRCHVVTGAVVTRILSGEGDRVRGLSVRYKGADEFLPAPMLIVAAGAIATPRLLLASADSGSPEGLANESGQVGRNFMETLLWTSSGLHPAPLGSHRGLPVDAICWDYNAPDAIPGVVGGCRFGPSQAESDLVGPKSYATRVVGGWGRTHKQQMRQAFGRVLSVTGIAESLPHAQSYVGLSAQVDDMGMPLAEIHSHVDDMAIKRIGFMAQTCRRVLKKAGVESVFEEFSSYDVFSSTHVFGTCRMGTDPRHSVVDAWCRSHRWSNLYVLDASVFPSSGGGESPGLTIQALALRSAEHIRRAVAGSDPDSD